MVVDARVGGRVGAADVQHARVAPPHGHHRVISHVTTDEGAGEGERGALEGGHLAAGLVDAGGLGRMTRDRCLEEDGVRVDGRAAPIGAALLGGVLDVERPQVAPPHPRTRRINHVMLGEGARRVE